MAYDDLRGWIAALERAGELKTIRTEVDPILEITEIADRVSKSKLSKCTRRPRAALPEHQGPSRIASPDQPVRFRAPHESGARGRRPRPGRRPHPRFHGREISAGFSRQSENASHAGRDGEVFSQDRFHRPCKEVIKRDNFSLLDFPILQCWPKDAGRFITLPCVVSRDPKTGKRNVGMYRMQVYDERTTGMHWQRQKVGAEHYREALRTAAQSQC